MAAAIHHNDLALIYVHSALVTAWCFTALQTESKIHQPELTSALPV